MDKSAPKQTSDTPTAVSPARSAAHSGAPAAASPAPAAVSIVAKPTEASPQSDMTKPVEVKPPVAGSAAPKATTDSTTPAPSTSSDAEPAAAAGEARKPAVAKPVDDNPAAAIKSAPAAKKSAKAKPAAAKPASAKSASKKPATAVKAAAATSGAAPAKASAAMKPVAQAQAAVARKSVDIVEKAAVKTAVSAQNLLKAMPEKAAILSRAMPRMPEFSGFGGTAWMSQAFAMARMVGDLQAKVIDHACNELKENLEAAQTLARTGSPADAIALQAKAVRRGYEAYSAHLNDLARTASVSLRGH